MPNRVDLHLHDGSTRSAEILDSRGTPIHPLSTDGVLEKARALCDTNNPEIDLESIVGVIEGLSDCEDIAELTDLLIIPNFEDGMHRVSASSEGSHARAG